MKGIRFIVIILTGMVLHSCTNLKEYYFPYSSCIPYKVYKYECFADSTKTQYWKMSFHANKKAFVTESFNYQLKRIEYFEEFIGNKGTQLVEFAEVVDGKKQGFLPPTAVDVYKWNDKSSYDYSVKFQTPSGLILFEKGRKYVGREMKKIVSGEYNCIKFDEIYTMTLNEKGEAYRYKQFTYYAKALGMIKYERFLPNGEVVELELTQVLDKSDWKKLKNSSSYKL